jgi:3-deoxy-D-manno-octulosonate 8-phosphate phosphatase (KDO 8-P phosphatase)
MRINRDAQRLLPGIAMLVMDVDGVLTNGDIVYTDAGVEQKVFDVKDGLGLRVAVEAGLQLALVTGRISSILQRRARDLRIKTVLQRVGDKEAALRSLAEDRGLPLTRVAYMGDDLNDRAALRVAGISIAPADAVPDIAAEADILTDAPGGKGAARQVVELILRSQGKWEPAVEKYLAGLAERDTYRRPVETEGAPT